MAYRIHLMETGEQFCAEPGESVLDAATRANVRMAHECTFGGCGTCRVKLLEGRVEYEEQPMALSEEEAACGYALVCQARACSDLEISVASGPSFAEPRRIAARVAHIASLCSDVTHLALEVDPDQWPDYRAGQYMNIVLPDGQTRSFSMASDPRRGRLDFHVRRIAGGRFTDRWLAAAQAGAPLEIEAPLGTFCYHEQDYRPLVMVATGTGLAPIKAMLESLLDDDECPPVSLYWGMRTEADLYLRDAIASWQGRLYEFDFVPVLSRPDAGWRGRSGYVQDAVLQDFDDLSEHALYLCGSPTMIAQAKHRFAERGASLDHLYADSFTFQHPLAAAA
ncbi:2Fe-2S iron-sulfur cluster binding domain-containing protein [Bordetella parapertussis]|uniref:CDP-6-deoxy-delta-3,4-glucoseen reductase n=2 Tax=Bordetella parapertussis TaxID=519 RepID=Q7W375_BORPA|nr:2Fe-2S iron-sulfur cluster-binding protein [Bordetella parapertussis]AOB41053.1 CDP-6-deoxy-delta-3,4-glucoseen reductase [Bordetella parapertussis]AUL45092.1 CDP-6-deoxy-delta-3,4-glucoseen reductase [Bordetella parapertussis]AWP64993.1 CDP-6-deoxy-delta-3,4-glucoseen reductase [Bordetella parapertussis]AWP72502.1 CDP-6-deoxy-delta-3,4-glucoseen reductase [Bordetella parapertussis]AWP91103.1 CDP-6-deoxy-delta-3,4-glucoseen reductase [Bordetella parapertussis]